MRLGKIVTLLLAGFLTFSSLNSLAATKSTKTKSSISTKKQATSNVTKKTIKTSKNKNNIIKGDSATKKTPAKELHKHATRKHFQTGMASYYANKFNGRRTANGDVFSNKKMTAAHRTLPFGTLVEVTNLRNGRSVVVRINDRGPYAHPRVLDLSSAAAKKIGMHRSGVAKVKIAILNKNTKSGSSRELYALN